MPNAPLVDNKRSWYPLPKTVEDGSIEIFGSGNQKYVYPICLSTSLGS